MRAIDKTPRTGSGSTAKAVAELPPAIGPVEIDLEALAEVLGAMEDRTVSARVNQYPDSLGYDEPFKRIIRRWRPELRANEPA